MNMTITNNDTANAAVVILNDGTSVTIAPSASQTVISSMIFAHDAGNAWKAQAALADATGVPTNTPTGAAVPLETRMSDAMAAVLKGISGS